MKRANNIVMLLMILVVPFIWAQDIQSLYDEVKEALLSGDHQTALDKIVQAKKEIENDPMQDPNGVFTRKLFPTLETAAQNMAKIVEALDNLFRETESSLVFPDLPPSKESVEAYLQQAKAASGNLLQKRDEIFASYDLPPEYRESLRKTQSVNTIEQLATGGILEKLSLKFSQIFIVLNDSLKAVDGRFKATQNKLEKMMKSAAAGKAQIEKTTKELTRLSEERIGYVNTISAMLAGEASNEQTPLRVALMENQVESVFRGMIESETKRVKEITSVDSTGYKELMKNYQRIKNYNQIFINNKVAQDQSALLANYEAALKAVKVVEPKKFSWLWLLGGAVLVAAFLIFLFLRGTGKKEIPAAQP